MKITRIGAFYVVVAVDAVVFMVGSFAADMLRLHRQVRFVPQPDSSTATNHDSIRSDRKLFQSDNSDAT